MAKFTQVDAGSEILVHKLKSGNLYIEWQYSSVLFIDLQLKGRYNLKSEVYIEYKLDIKVLTT